MHSVENHSCYRQTLLSVQTCAFRMPGIHCIAMVCIVPFVVALVSCISTASNGILTRNSTTTAVSSPVHPLKSDTFKSKFKPLQRRLRIVRASQPIVLWLQNNVSAYSMPLNVPLKLADAVEQRARMAEESMNHDEDARVLWTLQEYCRSRQAIEEEAIDLLQRYPSGLRRAFKVSPVTNFLAADVLIDHCSHKAVTNIALLLLNFDFYNYAKLWRGRYIVTQIFIDNSNVAGYDNWVGYLRSAAIAPAQVKKICNQDENHPQFINITPIDVLLHTRALTPEARRHDYIYALTDHLEISNEHMLFDYQQYGVPFNLVNLEQDINTSAYYIALFTAMLQSPTVEVMIARYNYLRALGHDGNIDIASTAHILLIISSASQMSVYDSFHLVFASHFRKEYEVFSELLARKTDSHLLPVHNVAFECIQLKLVEPLYFTPQAVIHIPDLQGKYAQCEAGEIIVTLIAILRADIWGSHYELLFAQLLEWQLYFNGATNGLTALDGVLVDTDMVTLSEELRSYVGHYVLLRPIMRNTDLSFTSLYVKGKTSTNQIIRHVVQKNYDLATESMYAFHFVNLVMSGSPSRLAMVYHAVHWTGRVPFTDSDIKLVCNAIKVIAKTLHDQHVNIKWVRHMRVVLLLAKGIAPELENFYEIPKPDRALESNEEISNLANQYLKINIWEHFNRISPYAFVEPDNGY